MNYGGCIIKRFMVKCKDCNNCEPGTYQLVADGVVFICEGYCVDWGQYIYDLEKPHDCPDLKYKLSK